MPDYDANRIKAANRALGSFAPSTWIEAREGGLDWWHTRNVNGPSCSHRSGCRQRPLASREEEPVPFAESAR